ncbi:lactoylglutathione lyase [Klebsormidium nitens]|uniref:Lactoylglutathione lyase n=1 Tax=Klebsormidium nitens TaxID=105231 RepID=A0A1Y1ICB0_KLENI|nr:lactoylglutathione lyase [Klebsormidium nitens]|eukprot:GAQ88223.1 lactoylglutathione lyase [Klebsormidium nitens]
MDHLGPLPVRSLNHISRVSKSLSRSIDFYTKILGFYEVKRPGSLDIQFEGAWLFNYGVGIHLLKDSTPGNMYLNTKKEINPKADHLSFQSDDLGEVERRLKLLGIEYVCRSVIEDGIEVQQLFFHDPDGFMIEVCNCENIPVVPLGPRCGRPLSRRLSNSQKRAMAINCELIDSTMDRPSPRLLDAACRVSPRLSSQNALPGGFSELGLASGALQGVRV